MHVFLVGSQIYIPKLSAERASERERASEQESSSPETVPLLARPNMPLSLAGRLHMSRP